MSLTGHLALSPAGPVRRRPQPRPCIVRCLHPPLQDKLSSQSFGTDLPLVDYQVEQHNIFHNEVKAIGPHLAKDGGKVSASGRRGPGKEGSHLHPTLTLSSALFSGAEQRTPGQVPETAGETGVGGTGTESECSSNRIEGGEAGTQGPCLRGVPVCRELMENPSRSHLLIGV